MKDDLEGHAALVTGAASGIGRATADKLAAEGADIALVDIDDAVAAVADEVAAEHGVETAAITADVSDEDQVAAMVDDAVDRFGGLDVVVNNAGLGVGDQVEGMDTATYRKMMDVNVDGMFFVAREALPHLRESEGTLVFLGSIAGKFPRPTNPVYAATKWWTRGFASSLSAQVGGDGVAITTVNPSEVRTNFAGEDGDPFQDRFDEGEVTEPDDVADAIVHAAKREAPNAVSEIDLYRRDKLSGL